MDYDLGRNGVAYFDNDTADYHVSTGKRTSGNRGNTYRNDGVDIRMDSTAKNAYYVTNFEKGEWLQYTLNVTKKGVYNLKFNCVSKDHNGRLSLAINDSLLASIDVKESNEWQIVELKEVHLKGDNKLRIIVDEGNFDLKSIEFVKPKP